MFDSLFGSDFEIKVKEPKVKELVKKVKEVKVKEEKEVDVKKILKSKKITLEEQLEVIRSNVYKTLGKQKDNIIVIRDNKTFEDYISAAITAGRLAIDTETNNSLDPITCKIMGLCLYYPGGKQAYIPINHINNETGELLDNQCTEEDIKNQLQRIEDNHVFTVFHNYKFDYKVIKCTCGIEVHCDWDTMIVAKLIDENEHSAGLKQQYISKIDPSQEKYSIDHLFENVQYAQVDPEVFAMYAATDSMMTDKLYLWQKPIMESYEKENPDLNPYKLFREVELPCIQVVAEMELNGVLFDTAYADRLRVKFEGKLNACDEKINEELDNIKEQIRLWRLSPEANAKPLKKGKVAENRFYFNKDKGCWLEQYSDIPATADEIKQYHLLPSGLRSDIYGKSKAEQLGDPIALSSPTQLAILLYDIMKVPVTDKDAPRGTGEAVLEALKGKYKICEYLLERRGLEKMLNAFINSLPNEVNPKTGKIHCSFNQYGAATGRTSCSGPNLQQIPSHEKSIRLLFMADPGYTLIGSDFSQQEVRVLADMSRDPNLIKAYQENKDIYATVASGVYGMDYWDCMEHHQDGSANIEGKKRRSSCKSVVLGLMYSRGAAAIAEQLNCTKEEAQKIIDNFYGSFSTVKAWMDKSLKSLRETGYTTDFYGRRRRLPDIKLPKYEFKLIKQPETFNPIIGCDSKVVEPSKQLVDKYMQRINACRSPKKEIPLIQADAAKENILIKENQGFIAQAERQCVNARIQGSSATMTKIAMNKIFRDPELNSYGFKLLINVHDELIGQCKVEYADKCAERLTTVMKTCVSDIFVTPFKCDPDICHKWYASEVANELQETKEKMLKDGNTEEEIFDFLCNKYSEFLPEEIHNFLEGKII